MLLSVVIPTYKAADYLRCCVRSLCRSYGRPEFEVCIYGDGGGDDSRIAIAECEQLLRAAGIAQRCFYNEKNLGNTAAVNKGAQLSSAEWLFFVNDDMVFPADWFLKVREHLRSKRVISLPCFEPDVAGHRPARCFLPLNLGLDPNHFGFEKLDEESAKHADGKIEVGVNYPFAAEKCFFLQVGAGDELFPGPYHDPDLFLRFRLAGAEFLRVNSCYLYHFSGISIRFAGSSEKKEKSSYWQNLEIKARLDFVKKWGAKPKARFGDVPKTRAVAPWNARRHSVAEKAQFFVLLTWERARALWLKFKNVR